MSFMLFTNISRRTASGAPPMLKKIGSFWTFECVFWCFWMWMLRKISSISQRFGSSRSSQNVYWHLKQKRYGIQPRKVTPHSLKIYIYIYVYILSSLLYTTYIYMRVCVFIFIFIITILMILVIPIGKDATYCALSSFRGFEGATTGWFADTIVGPSLKSPLVRNATSRKAGKLQDVVFNPSQNQHISTWLGLDYHPRYGWKQWNTQAVYLKPWVWITLFCTNIIHKKNWVCDYSEDKSPLKRHGQKMFLPAAGPPHKSQRPQRCDWSIPIPTQQHIQDVYIYSNPLYKNTKETGIGL